MGCAVVRPDAARPQSPASVASAGSTRPGRREERPCGPRKAKRDGPGALPWHRGGGRAASRSAHAGSGGNGDHIGAGLRQTWRGSASGRWDLRPMGRQLAGALSQNPMDLLGLGQIASRQRHA
jgi:hypothetical protein